ncbi:MAG: hypothetical protein B7Y86_07200 [Brevundimonas subvibrioides]|uniref:Uncharacterized protein n=1 Tax=Brevundimonas subvibrioides TaxID=74313 RepID=A0A258HJR8_9CAUL|nr:hypothetical protein [Brevundimonas subvibrioides]OYX56568.1 MAG: hypothetical protein B7Y86_07200 [Brevundimonas subvibrioides]
MIPDQVGTLAMTPTGPGFERHDGLTVAAIAVIASLAVIVNHEALGHGSVCLGLDGQVTLLSSSLFRCSVPSAAIDIGGPLMNLILGVIALIASRTIAPGRPGWRLGLTLVAAFAGFWEGGYLVQAMAMQKGDLYSAGAAFIGEPSWPWRIAGSVGGVTLYLATLVVTLRGLATLGDGRRVGRIAWLSATTAAVVTASVYRGGWGENLLNTFLEIGLASLPLLVMPVGASLPPGRVIGSRPQVWIIALVVMVVFAATQGQGIGDPGLA